MGKVGSGEGEDEDDDEDEDEEAAERERGGLGEALHPEAAAGVG